jgi:hypothetical protein
MTDLTFKRQVVDSIDMYVSTDGSETAVSRRGLAVLCGVSVSAIIKLIDTLASVLTPEHLNQKNRVPKELKHLCGLGVCTVRSSTKLNQYDSVLIRGKAAADIVGYYAFDSHAKNEVALFSYRRFAAMGVDSWIKSCVGYVEPPKPQPLSVETLKLMHATIGEHILNQEIIARDIPGLGRVLSAYKEPSQVVELYQPFTIREYLEAKGISKSVVPKFAYFLSGFYRGTTLERPEKTTYLRGKFIGRTNTYNLDKVPMLDDALEAFSTTSK